MHIRVCVYIYVCMCVSNLLQVYTCVVVSMCFGVDLTEAVFVFSSFFFVFSLYLTVLEDASFRCSFNALWEVAS